ncbi:MAG: HU family DNA-binding protein [Muribaculaceae bacterium]|nr:HU family DNA-binding protein [Muribaculaceae bacterium]
MDNKQYITALAKRTGLDYKTAAEALTTLASIMKNEFLEGNSIAIPGFGTFSPVKVGEEIVNDLATGSKLLLPPSISLQFSPANSFINKLNK